MVSVFFEGRETREQRTRERGRKKKLDRAKLSDGDNNNNKNNNIASSSAAPSAASPLILPLAREGEEKKNKAKEQFFSFLFVCFPPRADAWFLSPLFFFYFFSLSNCDAPSMIASLLHVH